MTDEQTDDLKARMGQSVERAASAPTIRQLIEAQRDEIALALPKHLDADRLARMAITVVKRTPQLAEATASSLLGSIMLAAQLGLEPGPLGHVYFIPYRNNKAGTVECQFMLGYRGMLELARRSGELLSIEAREVHEGDAFDYEYGTGGFLRHKPQATGPRDGETLTHVWGLAKFANGGQTFDVLTRGQVDAHRLRSATQRGEPSGPWSTDYGAMARKTMVRVMFPYLPQSTELAAALEADETVTTRIARLEDRGDVIDVPGELTPAEEGDG